MPRILLGAATFAADRGGIARVARLTGRVIAETDHSLGAVSYLDNAATDAPFAFTAANGSKAVFAARVHGKSFKADLCLYDSLGIARAHPCLTGLRRPYAVWLHGIEAWRPLPPRSSALLRGASRLFVNSQHTLERVTQTHGCLLQARVCHLATEEGLPPLGNRGSSPPTVLILGRIDASEGYKGHRELIEAWPSVLQKVPQARLLVAGDGSGLDALRRVARNSAGGRAIKFLGHVPESEIDAVWRRATVFAMPSRGEGFGLVYAEAMRRGIPVIASRHDAGAEVNCDGKTGFNVGLSQSGELAARIVSLLSDTVLADRMGAAARAVWQAEFSFPRFQARFGMLLAEWIAECAKGRH